jgi:hypothetical protein
VVTIYPTSFNIKHSPGESGATFIGNFDTKLHGTFKGMNLVVFTIIATRWQESAVGLSCHLYDMPGTTQFHIIARLRSTRSDIEVSRLVRCCRECYVVLGML